MPNKILGSGAGDEPERAFLAADDMFLALRRRRATSRARNAGDWRSTESLVGFDALALDCLLNSLRSAPHGARRPPRAPVKPPALTFIRVVLDAPHAIEAQFLRAAPRDTRGRRVQQPDRRPRERRSEQPLLPLPPASRQRAAGLPPLSARQGAAAARSRLRSRTLLLRRPAAAVSKKKEVAEPKKKKVAPAKDDSSDEEAPPSRRRRPPRRRPRRPPRRSPPRRRARARQRSARSRRRPRPSRPLPASFKAAARDRAARQQRPPTRRRRRSRLPAFYRHLPSSFPTSHPRARGPTACAWQLLRCLHTAFVNSRGIPITPPTLEALGTMLLQSGTHRALCVAGR